MGSEPDDDDVRSFGSEPDFAAMSSLRISSGTDAGPSPNGGHVFDELLDDPPRPFDHDLREAEATSLQALLDRFEELLRRDGGEGDEDDDGGERRREETERDPSRRPRRVRSDRQNDMVPVAELARRWRRVGFVPAPGSRRRASITPSIGVQWVPAPPETRAGQPRRRDPHAAAADDDDDDDDEPASSSSPWIEAMRGAAGEWWCDAEKAPGFFTVTGRGYDKTRIDARGRGRSTNDDEGGEEDGDASGEDETDETIEDTFAVAHSCVATDEDDESDARRWRLGVPCLDPETVIALDLAFAWGEVCAGEVEPPPVWVAGAVGSGDDDDDDLELSALWGTAPGRGGRSEGSEWSEAGSEEREAYELPEGASDLERTP